MVHRQNKFFGSKSPYRSKVEYLLSFRCVRRHDYRLPRYLSLFDTSQRVVTGVRKSETKPKGFRWLTFLRFTDHNGFSQSKVTPWDLCVRGDRESWRWRVPREGPTRKHRELWWVFHCPKCRKRVARWVLKDHSRLVIRYRDYGLSEISKELFYWGRRGNFFFNFTVKPKTYITKETFTFKGFSQIISGNSNVCCSRLIHSITVKSTSPVGTRPGLDDGSRFGAVPSVRDEHRKCSRSEGLGRENLKSKSQKTND